MMQDESIDLSNNNNLEKYVVDAGGGKRSRNASVNSQSAVEEQGREGEAEVDDPLSSDHFDFESVATGGTGTENENETADGDSDHQSSNHPVVKVKTLVEYHLEFLTKHPGEVFFYGCKLCTNRFTSRNSFLIHMKLHNVRKRYPCQHCDKAYDRKFQLVHHLRLHTEETPFECGVCFMAYATEPELTEHSKIHRSEKPFECRFCLKGFPQKKALIVHLRMHTGERPFHCPLCERTFTQKAHLQGHMVRIHIPKNKDSTKSTEAQAASDKATAALILQNIFTQKHRDEPQDLSSHSENNTDSLLSEIDFSILSGQREKLIECDFCDKKFTYERNKINHMRKHGYTESGHAVTGGNVHNNTSSSHQCGLCHMNFSSTALLMSHVLTHSGNNFMNSFGSSSNLPFHCDICGREFNMKRNLIMHVKSHNNERPHQCPACEKNFKLKYFLELHVSKIHPHINIEDLDKKDHHMDMEDDDDDIEKMDLSTSDAVSASRTASSPEKENAAMNLTTVQPTPNKRKQSQPKKVIMRTDLYETDSDTSYGEPYTSGSEDEMEEGDYDDEMTAYNMMMMMQNNVDKGSSLHTSLVQHQPKNLNSYNAAKSMQINLPHDLQHVKSMLNPKATVALSEPQTISCPLCSIVVSSKAALAIHVKEHEKNKTHQCTMCEKVYIQQASFEKHMKKHMLDEIAARQTKMIEQATMSLKSEHYDQPTGRIEGRKPLECNICRKKYAQPASFEKHMRLHSELGDVAATKNDKTTPSFDKVDNYKNIIKAGGQMNVPNSNERAFINPSDFLEVSIKH